MAKGKVTQVIGTVVDIEFPPDELPALYNAIEIPGEGGKIVVEVQGHLGNNRAQCLALSPTDGLGRGAEAIDTGAPLTVGVGQATLGRLFNVMGEPIVCSPIDAIRCFYSTGLDALSIGSFLLMKGNT